VASTVTNLSAYTNDLVINTGTAITATAWQNLIDRVESLQLNRYNVHPGQLASDGACDIIYDQSRSTRTLSWGTGTLTTVSMTVEVEWPRAYLANSFFNLGSEFVFSPYWPSMSLLEETTVSVPGLLNYQFQTALDTDQVYVPLRVNDNGSGRGPVYHIDFAQHPYGSARPAGSGDYWYSQYGSPVAVSGSASTLAQSPLITGTSFQFVGLHYGDYTTQLVIGVQQGQSVPPTQTSLRVWLNGNSSTYYTAQVPGYLGLYTGPNGGSLSAVNGWWLWEYDSSSETYVDRQYSWIEIFSGRKGQDPIGLGTAIGSRTLNTISLVPSNTTPGSATASASTITNAWAQFITRLNQVEAKLYNYSRDKWVDPVFQYTTTVFTSTLAQNTFTVSISAQREVSTVGLSRRLVFTMSATNVTVGSPIALESPYTYVTSTNTCNNIISLSNAYDSSSQSSYGGGGSNFPWWLVVVVAVAECFSKHTLISMADDSVKMIKDVKVGDLIWNHDRTRVNRVLFVESKVLDTVNLYSPRQDYAPFITENHPLIVDGVLMGPDADKHWSLYPWLGPIKEFEHCIYDQKNNEEVYNLWLDGDHTYIVNGWATHSIIDDGGYLRLAVEQGYLTKDQALTILHDHCNNGSSLLAGSYIINNTLGMINNAGLNSWFSHVLSGSDSWQKTSLWMAMRGIGRLAQGYYWAKKVLMGKKSWIIR